LETGKAIWRERRVKSLLSSGFLIEKAIVLLIVVFILLFILYPIFMVISTSVYNRGVLSFENYSDLLSPFNLGLIRNSVFVATLSSLLGTFFAFCVALHVFFQKRKWGELIYRSLMITMISPPFISAIALIMLFGRRGLITHGILGLSANPYGWQGIVLLQTLSQISLASIMLISALNSIDSRLIQASRDLGANPTQTVFRVILPSIFPAIMSVLFLFFTMNMADFGTPIIIGGNFNVLAAEAYLKTFSAHDIGKAATLSVLLIPPAIVAFYFYRKNIGKINTLSEGARVLKGAELNFRLPLVIKAFIGGVTGAFFFCMILKYGIIFLAATTTNVSGELVFTWNHIEAFHYRYVDALYRSLHMSIIAGLLSSVIGILLSYYTHRLKLPLMKSVEFIASLPYIIPGLFFGLGYIVAFHNEPLLLTGTMAILVLNCTFRHISVGNKAANAAFENIDSKLEMAARDLGTSRIGVLFNVIFPLLKSSFLVSFINTFTKSMTTVGPIIFLATPRNMVSSVLMFHDITNGRYGLGAVVASLLIFITVSVNLVAIKFLSKEKEEKPVTDKFLGKERGEKHVAGAKGFN